jgi:putative phosphoesterase
MRILLVADIHANWQALQALNEPHDVCLFLGDLVDYGLEPGPCIDWVRKHAQHSVRGNHDHGVAQNVVVSGQSGFKYLTSITRPVTRQKLTADERRFLAELPVSCSTTLGDLRFLLVHATPRDPLDEYAPGEAEFWEKRLEGVDADVICVGHTHVPYVLEIGTKLVVNPGSVGLPRDGDPRASYAVMEGRAVELKRYEYPVETTVGILQESSLPDQAKRLLTEVYRSGEARSSKANSKVRKSDTKVLPPASTAKSSTNLPRVLPSGPRAETKEEG